MPETWFYPAGQRELLQGNEAIAAGALMAGCRFFAGYPITPATEISEVMAERLPVVGGTFIQMEDEIASLGAVLGASLAGAKAMTATSGPGFSLMQENLGFACLAEIPCVIVNVMRGGPSTGLPTQVSQEDVMQSRWGTHGDHPIIVLAPATVADCYYLTIRAFNLTEFYRTPVILLSDEVVSHTREIFVYPEEPPQLINRPQPQVPPEWYIPYEDTPHGVPPMAPFGHGYRYHVTGLIHDVRGFPTQRPEEILALRCRLARKLEQHLNDIITYDTYAVEDAELLVIAYGSVARSARRAVQEARLRGLKAGLLRLITLWPFPDRIVERHLLQVKVAMVAELNQGQVVREVLRVNQGETRVELVSRIDGQLLTPAEIVDHLLRISR